MINEASFSVSGYVATEPKGGYTRDGTRMLSMRVGWTPRRLDRTTGEWADQPSSFVSVQCFRKVAEHAAFCLRRGDPVVLSGTLRVREYSDRTGAKRISVDVVADTLGHDMSRGISMFSRHRASLELTAAEREQAVAAERDPLPGDRPAALTAAQFGSDSAPGDLPTDSGDTLAGPNYAMPAGGSADRDLDDRDFDADADETFDPEDDSADMLTQPAEPVPVLA